MHTRNIAVFGLAALLGATALVATASPEARSVQNARPSADLQMPVTVKQLPPENGVIPVELRRQKLSLKFLTLGVLVACLVSLSNSEHFGRHFNAGGQQQRIPVVSVLSQPDAPLRISLLT